MRRCLWLSFLVTAAQAFAFQKAERPRSALERRGLHHAGIHGKFLSPTGEPVAGVHVQLNAGAPRALPVADAVTGPDGIFRFSDINSEYMPDLRWYPPEQWMTGAMPLMGESASEIDAGTIHLERDTVVRVAVEIVGETPPDQRTLPPILAGKGNLGPRIVAEQSGPYQIFRQIPFEDGQWEVSLFVNRQIERYTAPAHIERGRRDQVFLLRLLRNTVKATNQYNREGKLEVTEAILPSAPILREFQATGRVLAPNGTPVEGAFVLVNDIPDRRVRPAWAATDAQGTFHLTYQSVECISPSVSYPTGDFWFADFDPQGTPASCEEKWRTPHDLPMRYASRLSIAVDGGGADVRAYWWHDSLGWQRFSTLQPWLALNSFGDRLIKVEADGFLPLLKKLDVPYVNNLSKTPPPAEVTASFQFDRATQRALVVRGNGAPLAGATVDLEAITDLEKDSRTPLATYRIPANGTITLAGGADQLVEAFVYAGGFEPRRAIWNPGSPLTLDLHPRNATLSFAPSSAAILARVKDTTSPGGFRSVKLSPTESAALKVPPGTYDVILYDSRGAVTAYQRVDAAAGATKTIDGALDQRPRLTVRYPNDGWHASVSESVPRGGATQWTAMLSVGGTLSFTDTAATLDHESAREATFLLSHAGKMHVELRKNSETLSLWREIDVQPLQSLTIDVPPLTATLKGSMRTYTTTGFSIHGFAGPRFQMISDDPAGWSVTEYTPGRDGGGGFTIKGLPAGTYHVYQHLIGETKTETPADGKPYTYMSPIAAWGGIPVTLQSGQTAQLQDFIDYPYQDLHVRVSDRNGRPLEHATVRIRDRMSESWRQVAENPAQLEEAAYPIPYPAAARLAGGAATLPRVRAGALDLFVELDSGSVYSFTVPVTLNQELRLTVPEAQ
jgi:hypothetical protein